MTIDIVVPQIGEAVAELTLTQWLKQVGDEVEKGEVLFEIDSDKAIVEVEAFVAGTLVEIIADAGSSVLPQDVVARLQPVAEDEPSAPTPKTATADTLRVSPVAQRLADDLGVDLATVVGSGSEGRITAQDVREHAEQPVTDGGTNVAAIPTIDRAIASPKAKRVARELGVSLGGLAGSGVDGLIIVKDVETTARRRPRSEPRSMPAPQGTLLPFGKLRQRIAENTSASKQTIPHFYLMVDADMTGANQLRTYCVEKLGWEQPPTYTDILIRACALAVEALPEVNRSYTEQGLVARDVVGIGVAVSTAGGLVAPVIPHAPALDLQETSVALREVAARARDGRLRPADLGQKSLVISNLGMYSVDAFVAIIDMPDPMILAVGRVTERFVPVNGQPVIKPMCTLTLSVDHRAMDGVQGAQFLEAVKDRLEHPYEILGATR